MRALSSSVLARPPAVLLALLVSACGQAPAAPSAPTYRPIATTKELMQALDPVADAFWEPVGTIITKEGTFEKSPANDEEWAAIRNDAILIRETGSMLLFPSRAGGNAEWIKQANAMIDSTDRAIKAIDAKDKDALFNIGAEVYESCTNCHRQFMPAIVDAK